MNGVDQVAQGSLRSFGPTVVTPEWTVSVCVCVVQSCTDANAFTHLRCSLVILDYRVHIAPALKRTQRERERERESSYILIHSHTCLTWIWLLFQTMYPDFRCIRVRRSVQTRRCHREHWATRCWHSRGVAVGGAGGQRRTRAPDCLEGLASVAVRLSV